MASSMIARAALPSSGRPLRFGSGSLPTQGSFVLAFRRNTTGRGEVVAVEFKVPFPRPAWDVKATSAESESEHTTEGADFDPEEEFELARELKASLDLDMTAGTSHMGVLFLGEKFLPKDDQIALASYAEISFALWTTVTDRFRPQTESKLYEGLRLCGKTLASALARCKKCQATWKMVSDVVEALDLLRRLVSSTLEAPLPQDWSLPWNASSSLDYNIAEMGLTLVLQRTSVLVIRDIESMLQLDDANKQDLPEQAVKAIQTSNAPAAIAGEMSGAAEKKEP